MHVAHRLERNIMLLISCDLDLTSAGITSIQQIMGTNCGSLIVDVPYVQY